MPKPWRLVPLLAALALILLAAVVACGAASQEPTVAPTASPESDRVALVAVYNATNGPNWRETDAWLSDAPLNEWHGVSTDDSGRVIQLNLTDNQLNGEIPPELGSLTSLTALYLGGNQLSGAIPPALGNLANLEVLHLSYSQLSGEIPPELGNLASLTMLFLDGNQLSGCVPATLQDQLDLREFRSDLGALPFC